MLCAVLGFQCSCDAFLTPGGHLWGHSGLVAVIWEGLGFYLWPEEKKLPKLGQVNWKARSGKTKVRSGKLKVRSGWNQS